MHKVIRGAGFAAATLFALVVGPQAFAHITLATPEAKPNSGYRAVLRVPHGCDGKATTAIRVTLPDGVVDAKPMPKPGWTLTIDKGPYDKTYKVYGQPLSSGAKQIAWSNGSLPDDEYDEFVFTAWLSGDLPAGRRVYFPVAQQCGEVTVSWSDIPAAGQSPHALPHPAPSLMLAANTAAAAAGETVKVGDLVLSGAWAHATPKGAPVAGGYVRITNTGKQPDRLIGGTFPGADKVEVHQMSMDNGVMRMRPIAGGLEIKPGQTVALKPGGDHLMFMDFKGQLKAGQSVTGTLKFAKAGTVSVTYQVAPIGAPGPTAAAHHEMPMDMHMDMPMGMHH